MEKPNSCYGYDLDGKFCDVLCLLKQKYPHIKGMKDIASATLIHFSDWYLKGKTKYFPQVVRKKKSSVLPETKGDFAKTMLRSPNLRKTYEKLS